MALFITLVLNHWSIRARRSSSCCQAASSIGRAAHSAANLSCHRHGAPHRCRSRSLPHDVAAVSAGAAPAEQFPEGGQDPPGFSRAHGAGAPSHRSHGSQERLRPSPRSGCGGDPPRTSPGAALALRGRFHLRRLGRPPSNFMASQQSQERTAAVLHRFDGGAVGRRQGHPGLKANRALPRRPWVSLPPGQHEKPGTLAGRSRK